MSYPEILSDTNIPPSKKKFRIKSCHIYICTRDKKNTEEEIDRINTNKLQEGLMTKMA